MTDYQRCPFCAGHEAVSPEACEVIANLLDGFLTVADPVNQILSTELFNIRNAILNHQERTEPQEEYAPPICPTPDKRRYNSKGSARHDAIKWNQHPYECACGYWHNSKQSATTHASKINSPAASADEFETDIDPLLT